MTASGSHESAPGSREELLDLATLEAMGALEEESSKEFWRRFDAASPSLQAEIVERQAGLVVDPAFLAREEPAAILRERVLERIRAASAMRSSAAVGFASLDSLDAAVSPWSDEPDEVHPPLRQLVERMRHEQEVERRSRTAPWLWRAASLVLAAGLVVSFWFQTRLSERVASIAELAMQRETEDQLRSLIGPGLERFLAARCEVIGLAGGSTGGGAAALYVDPVAGDGFLVVLGLPITGGEYVLRAVDESGHTATMLSFSPVGAAGGFRIPTERMASIAGRRFEIVDAAGQVVLRTA